MIGIQNKDSSFFTVESPDISLTGVDFSKNLISLSISEKMSGIPQGSLSFYDPDHYFSKILRTGVRLIISWGYKNNLQTIGTLTEKKLNFDEVSGNMVRRGYQGFVSSPTGSGDSGGKIVYNCNFSALGFVGIKKSIVHRTGTKASVISEAFSDIGIDPVRRYINFTLGRDRVTPDKYVRQDESTFAFINRMAKEWQSFFYVSYASDGQPVGVFIDKNLIGKSDLPKWVLESTGKSNLLDYKGEVSNVISYKWSSSESENGAGSNVRLDIVDGQIQFRRYSAEAEKVITWRVDTKKIQSVYKDASLEGLSATSKITLELLSTKSFDEVKKFFIPIEKDTAPDGYGYRVNCEMIGNPLVIPGNLAVIGNGFPDRLGGNQSNWFFHSVDHNLSRSGYMMSVEVVDAFFLSPVGLVTR